MSENTALSDRNIQVMSKNNKIVTSIVSSLSRETKFLARERSLLIWMIVVFCLSSAAVFFGIKEINSQHDFIVRVIEADKQDRSAIEKKLSSWGSAAYYNFHFTYDSPSNFAFAALGQRDNQPWKHRIRMLALEGQIYERDAGNPVVALIGRFDFAFLAAFILPLVIIILLFDLRGKEKLAGRKELLEATAGSSGSRFSLWGARTSLMVFAIFLCAIFPLFIGVVYFGAPLAVLAQAVLFVFLYLVFWAGLCYFASSWDRPDTFILMCLLGLWLTLSVVLPAGAKHTLDRVITAPSGADILLLQREAVNDAWDLPREVTYTPFFERHPEWSDYEAVESSFEWQWYYAFQQVGDQKAEELSQAYRDAKQQRDKAATWLSFLMPPALLERALQSLAKTDFRTSMEYEQRVRRYHAELRAYYYPKLFRNAPFDIKELDNLPVFTSP